MAKRITQRMLNGTVLILVIVIIAVLIYSDQMLKTAISREQEATERKSACEQLGQTVSDASDFLTEEVRQYIITGKQEHFENYWSEVTETNSREGAVTQLQQMNLGTDVTVLLELAKTVSDELIDTEAEAMYLEECFLGVEENPVLDSYISEGKRRKLQEMSPKEQHQTAITLLFDEAYVSKKSIIYNYISDFRILMSQKLDSDVRLAKMDTKNAILTGNVLQIFSVALILLNIILIYLFFIRPVLYYEHCLRLNQEERMQPKGVQEIYTLGATIRAMYDKMKAAIRAKSDFLAVMSHEIRTPLHSMLGYHFLLSKTDLSEQQIKYVNYLQESTENLMNLVNNILDYSKLGSYKFQIEEQEFSIYRLAEEIEQSFGPLCKEKQLHFQVMADCDEYEFLLGDYTKIRQILNNLINNAVKFTNQGSVKVFLKAWEKKEQALLTIQVQDSGIGIRPEAQDKIFLSFEQADKTITRKYGGTGLGLPICKQMAELLGGAITVNSTEGKGSLFIVTIPVKIQEEQNLFQKQEVQIEWQFPDLTVLLVDDNEINGVMQKEILELFAMRVDRSTSGIEAVELAKQNKYDLIFMDIRMPDMDGYEAAREILATVQNRRAVIFALTADVQDDVRKTAQEAGMCEVLTKPLKASVIQSKLCEHFAYYAKRVEVVELMPDDSIQILDDNKKLYNNLVTLFVKNHERDFKLLQIFIRERQRREILDLLHMLNGVTGTIGAYPLQQSIEELQTAIKQKRITWGQMATAGKELYERFLSIKAAWETSRETEPVNRVLEETDIHTEAEIHQWNEIYEAFWDHIEESDFEAVELFQRNKSVFVEFLGKDKAERIEDALNQFDYEQVEEYL